MPSRPDVRHVDVLTGCSALRWRPLTKERRLLTNERRLITNERPCHVIAGTTTRQRSSRLEQSRHHPRHRRRRWRRRNGGAFSESHAGGAHGSVSQPSDAPSCDQPRTLVVIACLRFLDSLRHKGELLFTLTKTCRLNER